MSDFNAVLPADIIRGAGVLYIDGTTPFGASSGGLTFDPGKTINNTEYDGKISDSELLDYVVEYKSVIAGTFFPFSPEKVQQYEPGSTSATVALVTTVTPKSGAVEFVVGDYLVDVRLVFPRSSGGYAWVKFAKALITKWNIVPMDKGEAKISCEIAARLPSTANVNDAPFVIEFATAV